MEKSEKIWINGELIDWDDAKIHVLSHSLHYGSGIFEGIRCYKTSRGPAIFRLRDHIERLYDSALILAMEMPIPLEEFSAAVKMVVKVNNLEECYIRPLVIRGYGQMGINPLECPVDIVIAAWKWGAYLGEEAIRKGIKARISSFARTHVNTIPTKAKATGAYLNSMMAKVEAVQGGFQEAILLDTNGNLSEGTGENIFLVKGQEVRTVPEWSILPGITRDTICTLMGDQGYRVITGQMTRGHLYTTDEAFFTGTAAEVTPIREVDHRKIGDQCPGPVTKTAQELFYAVVRGKNPSYHHWLDWVE